MNKQDITIVVFLVILLGGWLYYQNGQTKKYRAALAERQRQMALAAATNGVPATASAPAAISTEAASSATLSSSAAGEPPAPRQVPEAQQPAPTPQTEETGVPEQTFTLRDGEVEMTLSSKGGSILRTTLAGYRQTVEKDSPDIVLDSAGTPILALEGIPGLGARSDFTLVSSSETGAVFTAKAPSGLSIRRTIALLPNYQVAVTDTLSNESDAPVALENQGVSMGEIHRIEQNKLNMLSVDALSAVTDKHGTYGKVDHWEKKQRVAGVLTGREAGGCSGAPDAALLPESAAMTVPGQQAWVALKSRFFAQVMTSSTPNAGYRVGVRRAPGGGAIRIVSVNGAMLFPAAVIQPGGTLERGYSLYIGPKKFSVLRHFGPKSGDIMDFGTWKYICIAVLWLLNVLFAVCRNYGVAIILITVLVRLAFWPLTHKSTESMKKLQEIQPLLKEVQAKFKDDPQKLMQEQQAIYREHKVNPMSSCLPMLIQIPFFIAIFFVLRSAVELRFAPFLWIRDLSDQENIFPGLLPLPINILPIIMAATMFLQSKLTPSMGDASQQKMMMFMMPAMMLVMFYTMPSALVLYWSVSQILAIVQLWRQRRFGRQTANAATITVEPEHMTRQARRRAERGEV
ncbi:MAG: membrane protein insertase YidC [Kiritimatiellae bacterium]|nr:membrane protein insertase YidC [Kiritimatiellia bacterium]